MPMQLLVGPYALSGMKTIVSRSSDMVRRPYPNAGAQVTTIVPFIRAWIEQW